MTFKEIPKLVINLPARQDRLDAVTAQLTSHVFEVIPGVKEKPSHKGIGMAHANAIRYALDSNMPVVCIMEDDCVLRVGFEAYLNEALNNLPEDWEILLGGVYEGQPMRHNSHWSKVGEFCGLHFYIVRHEVYQKILSEYDFKIHIDRWMNLRGDRFKCYVTSKFIATQSAGVSDNTGVYQDYSHMIKSNLLL